MDTSAMLTGFRGTRAEVLVGLKKGQPLTAKELAEQFGVTPNALRRHLKELESEGVVQYQRVVRGVGGPVFAYSLTEVGERLFPQSYDVVLGEALEMVRAQFGTSVLVELFRKRWEEITERHKPDLAKLPLQERATRLAELLTSLGYMAEATSGVPATLVEHNCTIRAVVERFPEVCAAEQVFIQEVLGVEVTRQAHMAKGANCCEYCLHAEGETTLDPGSALADARLSGMTVLEHSSLPRKREPSVVHGPEQTTLDPGSSLAGARLSGMTGLEGDTATAGTVRLQETE